MSTFVKHKVGYAVVAGVLALLQGCSAPSEEGVSAYASCVAKGLSDSQLKSFGVLHERLQPIELSWGTGLTCENGLAIALSEDGKAAATKEVLKHIASKEAFIAGTYQGLSPAVAPADVQERITEVSLYFRQAWRVRKQALSCFAAEAQTPAKLLAEVDNTLIQVSLMRYGGMLDASDAQLFTSALTTKMTQELRGAAPSACEPSLKDAFQAQIKQWADMASGNHPWTRGCKISLTEQDVEVQCE